MPIRQSRPRGTHAVLAAAARRLLPLVLVGVLGVATFEVWRLQLAHQHRLLARHTEDVCVQAARRLETFVDAQLTTAEVIAADWIHGPADSRPERFEHLAGLFLDGFASYHGLAVVDRGGRPIAAVIEPDASINPFLDGSGPAILASAAEQGAVVVSDPFSVGSEVVSFFAVWPLPEGASMLVEYRVDELVDDCFHGQIRREFAYSIEDEGDTLFRFAPAVTEEPVVAPGVTSVHSFPVRNRQWRLTVAPRLDTGKDLTRRPDLSVPILGAVLSIGVGLLVALVQQRAERFRVSESRYRGVFDAATDGLLVLGVDGTVLDANPAARQMLGGEPAGPVGRHLGSFLEPGGDRVLARLGAVLESMPSAHLETTLTAARGGRLDVEVHASRFLHNGSAAVLAVLTDVTQQRAAARRLRLLAQRALEVQEEERARVARELHDDLGQLLTALRLEVDFLRRSTPDRASTLAPASDLIATCVDSVRRLCKGLRPPLLDDLGLESALRQLVADTAGRLEASIALDVSLDDDGRGIAAEVGLCTYRLLQEALTNILRHAQCGRVRITVAEQDGQLELVVRDDGVGFDPETTDIGPGLGLTGMRERVRLLGGDLEIRSAPGDGATVSARLPVRGWAPREAS